jgi:DNA-binding beta-propeller fold protein YncE
VSDNSNHRVQKFACDNSNFHEVWGLPDGRPGSGGGQFDRPTGVAVDSGGKVYVADTNNHRVQKFTSTGAFLSQLGAFGGGGGQFNQPTGVAVNSDGDIYVLDRGNNRIQLRPELWPRAV